eukprot:5594839-Lingulodinium_polyedra.AAC.1
MTRSKRRFGVAAARKPRDCAFHARAEDGPRVECASVQGASRRGRAASIQPHHCAAFRQRCAMVAAVRKPRVR